MKAGDIVRFHTPYKDEIGLLFRVIEDRDTRLLIASTKHDNWPIQPVQAVLKADMELVSEAK